MITRIAIPLSLILIIFTIGISACSEGTSDQTWLSAVPNESPLAMLHHDADFFEVLELQQTASLEEMSSIQLAELTDMQEHLTTPLRTKAIALYPTGSNELQPVFILEDPGDGISTLARPFQKEFAVNNYRYQGHRIHILHLDDQQLFATQLDDWIILSKNSNAVENGILTYTGVEPQIAISEERLHDADFLLNTPKLENWVKQLGAPRYLPRFKDLFAGTGPAAISITDHNSDDPLYHLSLTGTIPLASEGHSSFVTTFSSDPAGFDLDRYIPLDAALFSIYHDEPLSTPPGDIDVTSQLDSLLISDTDRFQSIVQTLDDPTAFVAFEATGFLSTGEHMFLRRLNNGAAFQRVLNELVQEGYINRSNDIFQVSSNILARLLGGPVGTMTDFFVIRSSNAAVITQRPGLARRIDQDRRRRAVFYYDDHYMNIREQHPESVSAWIYSRNLPISNYLEHHLNPINHAGFLTRISDIGAASLVQSGDELHVQLDTYFTEERTEPVRDLWAYNLAGSRLTGKPVLANILGGSRNELIVATENNQVYGIASDGTGFMEMSTSNDRPVGSPIVFDWYGNNQYAVLVAAGNKVYAWNTQGRPLPNFPISMDEAITAPLQLADVARDGRPELIVATADRQVHVLDQRGRNISGWPQEVNVIVTQQPELREFEGETSLWITAGNGLFGFTPGGERRNHFPVFIESDYGSITFHDNHILAGASDGHLYAIGKEPFFADSLVVPIENDAGPEQENEEMTVRRVYVDNSAVINSPIVRSLTVPVNSDLPGASAQTTREVLIGVQSRNGNLFLLNEAGQLRMERNMGQAAADYDSMQITDLSGDGNPEIIGVTSAGRVYAWQVASGERIANIPAASIHHPIITDLLANGEQELIGQTRDGLRCWSFRRPE